ncbi:uncharacterized protein LOC131850103 [Achroia grisella]|uniref:uncharacterized protein LOC131850103 n=1 Tax=Achroia grisella TaxID=688607 RepID=UPI0027D2BE9D|nr:uncharacterized protein LOC131850103 [Achroia grisella]
MMSQSQWGELPLLPLKCILDHLSLEDALAATSACHHWRAALLLYEGHKETLKLRAKQLDKNVFLTRIFRKYVKRLHIYIDCNEEQLDKFITLLMPQFLDTVKLEELIFIGPSYIQQNPRIPLVKLKRIITESLIYKHIQSIQRLGFIGCGLSAVRNDEEKCTHNLAERYSRPLMFNNDPTLGGSIFSNCSSNVGAFSALRHVAVEYAAVCGRWAWLSWAGALPSLALLTLTVSGGGRLHPLPPKVLRAGLDVAVNIIDMPYNKFEDVMQNVLIPELQLISLKVMFCKTVYAPLVEHVACHYKETLREVLWADCPAADCEPPRRHVRRPPSYDVCNVNPFILLCWQCVQLQRLVIHGYWVWQYDVIGFVRLRPSLEELVVSSIYTKQAHFGDAPSSALRVLASDSPHVLDDTYVLEINKFTQFRWRPSSWEDLPRGLRARAPPAARVALLMNELARTPRAA